MKKKNAIARLFKKLAPLTVAAVLLTSGGAHAQLGTSNGGMTSPNIGTPSASPPGASSGIPFGATQLGTGGLSPAPIGATSGFVPSGSSSVGTMGTAGIGATGTLMPGIGSTSSLGNGLSPVTPPGSTSLSPGLQTQARGVTNYGADGTQALPGSPVSNLR
jgi:hypothetical protein